MTEHLCKHDLPMWSCASCIGEPRDRLQEAIDAHTTACRAKHCNTEIVWAITERGRRMPVDVAPSEDGTVELFLEGTEIHCRVIRQQALTDVDLRASHFQTCAEASSFRGRHSSRITGAQA